MARMMVAQESEFVDSSRNWLKTICEKETHSYPGFARMIGQDIESVLTMHASHKRIGAKEVLREFEQSGIVMDIHYVHNFTPAIAKY